MQANDVGQECDKKTVIHMLTSMNQTAQNSQIHNNNKWRNNWQFVDCNEQFGTGSKNGWGVNDSMFDISISWNDAMF